MLDQKQLENATPWELQCQLEFFQRDLEHAEAWIKELKKARGVLNIALRQKSEKPEKMYLFEAAG